MACRRRVALFWRLGFVASLPSDVVGETWASATARQRPLGARFEGARHWASHWLKRVKDGIDDVGDFERPLTSMGYMGRGTKWLVKEAADVPTTTAVWCLGTRMLRMRMRMQVVPSTPFPPGCASCCARSCRSAASRKRSGPTPAREPLRGR